MRTVAFWLSLIMIFTIPWENIVNLESLGTVSRAIGVLIAALWVVTVIVTGRFRKPHPFHLAVYLFILWNAVSVFWSVDVDKTASRIQTYFQLAVLVFILWDLYTTPAALRSGLQAYVLGAYVSIANTIYDYSLGNAFYYSRYAATGFNPNDLAIILALGMPVAWHLAMADSNTRKTHFFKVVNFAYLPAATFAILLTASRVALIAIAFTLLFVLSSLTRLRFSVRVLIIVVLACLAFVGQDYIPQSSLYRLNRIQLDLNGREAIWQDGRAIFSEHPLLGIGSNAFSTASRNTGKVAHNIVIALLAEIGIVGFSLFMFILAIVVYHLKFLPKWEAMFWLTVLMIWLLSALTHNMEYRKQTWLFLTLVIASANLLERRDECIPSLEFPRGRTVKVNWRSPTIGLPLAESVVNTGGLKPKGRASWNALQNKAQPDVQSDAPAGAHSTLLIGKRQ